jgi:nucleotidyltransferase-like protein
MTPESEYLLALAKRNAQAYIANSKTKAVMVTGSVAEGLSDRYSDIDMTVYYDELPSEDELAAARLRNGGSGRAWFIGDREQGSLAEAYTVADVECQFGHATIATWERDMATVLEKLDVASPLQKALSGTLYCIPLHGAALIQRWQSQIANYPDALAQAMVQHHMQFYPLWLLHDRMATRDATLWRYQILVEAAQNLLGVLAGLNRLYFSTFQFKRMNHFVNQMRFAPRDLSARLERLFSQEPLAAALELEALVREALELVSAHMPQVDVTKVARRVGQRPQTWNAEAVRKIGAVE